MSSTISNQIHPPPAGLHIVGASRHLVCGHIQAGAGWAGGEKVVLTPFDTGQDYTFLEFYAGHGNLHKMMRAAGRYKAARFDITDGARAVSTRRSNYMDLNSVSGFASLAQINQNHLSSCIMSVFNSCSSVSSASQAQSGNLLCTQIGWWWFLCSLRHEVFIIHYDECSYQCPFGLCQHRL